jgi:hypothetical protein
MLNSLATPRQERHFPHDQHGHLVDLACRISRTLAVASALARHGRKLDLTGFEDGIGRLCAQTLDLPEPEGRMMLPVLAEVLFQVEQLSALLRRHPGQHGPLC